MSDSLWHLNAAHSNTSHSRGLGNDEEQEQADQVPRRTLRPFASVNNGFLLNLFGYIQARIKKIMQKDEEVGKVAQATPIVICPSIFPLVLGGVG